MTEDLQKDGFAKRYLPEGDPNQIIELLNSEKPQLICRVDAFVRSVIKSVRDYSHGYLDSCLQAEGLSPIAKKINIQSIYQEEGVSARIIIPEQPWMKGKIRVKVFIEFEPDLPIEQENNLSGSPLDDLRTE